MKHEITVECPNCSEPLTLTPDKLGQEYIICRHCAAKHEVAVLKKAVKKELYALLKAYNEYLETVEI